MNKLLENLTIEDKKNLINYLTSFVTPERYNRMLEVLKYRTKYLTIVLENVYQSHNNSAVLRSSDCFGIQDIHIIENGNNFSENPDIALGSSNWLNIKRYNKTDNNTLSCLSSLKENGYRIVATLPSKSAITINNFDIYKGKFALVFGTEKTGLTDIACDFADEHIYLPMVGFTESLNISVTAAIFMQYFSDKIRSSNINWQLSDESNTDVLLNWLKKSIKNGDTIIRNFINT